MLRLFRIAKIYKKVTTNSKAKYSEKIYPFDNLNGNGLVSTNTLKSIKLQNSPEKRYRKRKNIKLGFESGKTPKESKVGKKLSELTTKRVIILVLALLLIIPLFHTNYYYDDQKSFILGKLF